MTARKQAPSLILPGGIEHTRYLLKITREHARKTGREARDAEAAGDYRSANRLRHSWRVSRQLVRALKEIAEKQK